MSNVVQGLPQYGCNSCSNIFFGKGEATIFDIFDMFKRKSIYPNIFKVRGEKCPKFKSKDIYVSPVKILKFCWQLFS